MGLGWNTVPYDGLYRLSGCCSMVLALSSTIYTSVKSYTFDNIWASGVIPKKGLLEHVTFFGDSRNPLQYSGEGHTPQISHRGHTEKP